MNRLSNTAICLVLSFISSLGGYSQLKFDKAVLVTKENGLPTNEIRVMKKGDDGFIWIATARGLCRFDGQQMKVFHEGKDLRYSLFDELVESLQPIGNNIWFGTSQGLSVLNTNDYTFKHYQFSNNGKLDSLKRRFDQSASFLYKDKNDNLWMGTRERGVALYDRSKDDFRFFPITQKNFEPLAPSLGTIKAVLSIRESVTNDSIVYAGTTAGLLQVNKYTGDTRAFTFSQKSKDYQVALNAFRRLYHHDDGLLYVGSWGAGVNVFDPITHTFTPLLVKNEVGKKIVSSVIGNLTRKSDHEIWISTISGIAIYDTNLKDVTWYKLNNTATYQFYSISFIDEADRAWYTDINGIGYFDPAMQQFSHHSFKHLTDQNWGFAFYILPDKDGSNITVCPRFSDGVYHFNRIKNEWTKTPFPDNNSFVKEREVVRGFVKLSSGLYIISSDKGMFYYSEKSNRLTRIEKDLPFAAPTRRGEILLDHTGNLWLSDDVLGLIKWKPGTNKYRAYNKELVWNDSSFITGRILHLFEDSKGNIWLHRGNGIGVYLADKDSILNFDYRSDTSKIFPGITSFAEDRNGKLWISGGNGWLGYALVNDPYKGVVHKLNIRDKGMANSFPFMATDKNGNVWGYTADELVKIDADNLLFTTYSLQYGVSDPEFFHFSFLPSGEMVFGGRNDIIIANPKELKRNEEIPVPYITEMQVLNQPFNLEMNNSPIHLKYKQNFFSVGFSAKAFTMPAEVKFRYRLTGFDEWTESTGRRFANYTNVPGGDYVFQLQAANNEGIWNEKILELPIYVATPFWRTWWFLTSLLLVVVFTGYWLYRYRIEQIRRKQKLKSDYEKKLANVEMSALLAQMNPHFLFNSLNSIDSYIIRNESKKASEYLNNFARLMRLILQNSRSNYISLKDELEALELYMQMESLRFKNKFCYSIVVDENVDTGSIVIPPMLIQPYVENAIWHGLMHKTNGHEGVVKISISKNENDLQCVIDDNGIGRKMASEIRAQKQTNHKRSMGMQITKDRMEIINKLYNMNASIHIYDKEDEQGHPQGTKVELIIPI